MEPYIPIILALITSGAGLIGGVISANRLLKRGYGKDQLEINKTQRELLETYKEKNRILEEDLERSLAANEEERRRAKLLESENDTLNRRLNDAYALLRDCEEATP